MDHTMIQRRDQWDKIHLVILIRTLQSKPSGPVTIVSITTTRVPFAGENFVRHTGDVKDFAHQQSMSVIITMFTVDYWM